MEMNTRIQVEHTVTELVTGLDLIREQVLDRRGRAALGDARRTSSSAATRSSAGSTPRTSRRASCPRRGGSPPTTSRPGPGVRVDSGIEAGDEVSELYDPMIAKLIVHDIDRETRDRADAARARRVPDRGAADAARLPRGAARASVLRRRRDVRGRRRVGGARRARAGARGAVLSSDNKCDSGRGRRADDRPAARRASRSTGAPTTSGSTSPSRRGRRSRRRRRERAARRRARPATAPCSARCRARC